MNGLAQSNFDPDQFDVSGLTDIDASSSNAVSEDASIGTDVGITAFAEDQDAADSVTYSLTNDAGGLFAINKQFRCGERNASLDYETSQQHTITVQALSTDQSTQSSDFTIDILDNADEHDVSGLTDIDASSNAVSEDASIGTEVGITAFAEDLDAADSVTYSLTNDAGGLFAINSNSGVVSVNASLDYETSQQHTIMCRH